MKTISLLAVVFTGLLFMGCTGSSSSAPMPDPDPAATTAADEFCGLKCSDGNIVDCQDEIQQYCGGACALDGVGEPYCGQQVSDVGDGCIQCVGGVQYNQCTNSFLGYNC